MSCRDLENVPNVTTTRIPGPDRVTAARQCHFSSLFAEFDDHFYFRVEPVHM